MPILAIKARQIFNSRGHPTLEVDVTTKKGTFRAAVPSGVSQHETDAKELRDGGPNFMGNGVSKAVNKINKILAPAIIKANLDIKDQRNVDNFLLALDGTTTKSNLGTNTIVGLSQAICRAGAAEKNMRLYNHIADLSKTRGIYLPMPMFNVINGGIIAGNNLAIQEFLLLPVGAETFREAMRMGTECYHNLKKILHDKLGQDSVVVGDEGGFAPNQLETSDALDFLKEAIEKAGLSGKVMIGMNASASEFFKADKYDLSYKRTSRSLPLSSSELMKIYQEYIDKYKVIMIEDPFDRNDWRSFAEITSKSKIEIVGGDLLGSDPARVNSAIRRSACNGVDIRVSQIGTVSEALEASRLAQEAGWGVVVSHRHADTEDAFISDLAVGLEAGHIKAGAPCRSEHLAKYNQLLRIEEQLGMNAKYVGVCFQRPRMLSQMNLSTAV